MTRLNIEHHERSKNINIAVFWAIIVTLKEYFFGLESSFQANKSKCNIVQFNKHKVILHNAPGFLLDNFVIGKCSEWNFNSTFLVILRYKLKLF
jgi:hypothetical protein